MNPITSSAKILFAASVLIGAPLPQSSEWTRADVETVRLSPGRVTGLSAAVRAELERRGCGIPQPFTAAPAQPQNAIRGHFTSAQTNDWAVLCSRQRRSSILVFRGGDVTQIDDLAENADATYLQVIEPGKIGYSRAVAVASPSYIRGHNPRAAPPLPALDHDGINDAFVEKGSVIWYWSADRWLRLAGSDTPTWWSSPSVAPAAGEPWVRGRK